MQLTPTTSDAIRTTTNMDENLQPCNSLQEACKQLLLHSFAIIRVNTKTQASLKSAWLASTKFFAQAYSSKQDDDDYEIEKSMITKYRKINNHNLLGFNRPSPYKLLFRVIFSNGKSPDSMQPWPDDIDDGSLKESSLRLMPCLHDLLCEVMVEIKRQLVDDAHYVLKENDDEQEPRYKKRKIEDYYQYYVDKSSSNDDGSLLDPLFSSCPLDYFYYHTKDEKVENCSEHVDRGLLICISLTNVAGLEVLSRQDGMWYCPEMVSIRESQYTDNETGCSDLVCILSGDQLRNVAMGPIEGRRRSSDNFEEEGRGRFPGLNACVHRVRQKLSACRLSITYELRHKI
mmetsp:Transcript_6729/g.12663  ORF Transcript_6729/g.12663 Transcript_6729/m.12663 type:complete len:344 (-) Transcript_6729:29-1060(-)